MIAPSARATMATAVGEARSCRKLRRDIRSVANTRFSSSHSASRSAGLPRRMWTSCDDLASRLVRICCKYPQGCRPRKRRTGQPWSLRRLRSLEISQIGRRLVPAGRHQHAVPTQEIVVVADNDLVVVLRAIKLQPVRTRIRVEHVFLVDGPRLCQRVVDHRELVVKDFRTGLVEMKPLHEDRLIIEVEGQAGCVVGARTLER